MQKDFNGLAFINGDFIKASDHTTFDNISPIDGQIITQIARCKSKDIDRAVQVARQSFSDRRWAGLPPAKRKMTLVRFAELLLEHADTLAYLETIDMGKPITEAKQTDVELAARCIRWYGEAIDKVYGETAPTSDHAFAWITQEPIGVVGTIVPWNYPMVMASWKIAPALAMGNSVVLKPSERASLTTIQMGYLAHLAGIPAGVFNVVPGFGTEAGVALAMHMDVDCLAFTGSTTVGKQIHVMGGQSNLKRTWTELGGKSPNIIFADCPDFDKAVETSIRSVFYNQGESCNAPSRLFVEDSIYDRVLAKALDLLPQYRPANPLLSETTMGALVDKEQLDTVLQYVHLGQQEGASLLAGGHPSLLESGGYYMEPTLFAGVHNHMKIAQEEIFGPVLSILKFSDINDVVKQANQTIYGLQAALWTNDLNKAHGVAKALRVGTVHINQYDEDDITVPFGGFKQSGIGRDKSLHALSKYTETKTTWLRIDSPV
jgi:gamma-glutamyl-gamma-aminobutyraldehyde dehydrogenase/4-guanidinobutyraldehyde dehydrogenase/NAD-dependent aldehyde dehydrogenase